MAVNDGVFLGRGDVNGPSSSTDNAIAVFSGTSGKVIKVGTSAVVPNLTSVERITFAGGHYLDGATANTWISSATGPYIWGSGSSGTPQWQWTLNGTYLPTGAAPIGGMMRLSPTITVPAAMAMRGYSQQPTFDFNNQTLSMDEVNAFEIDASPLTNKAGVTLHNLASLQIFGAMDPTGLAGFTGKSYSLWINDSITGIANTRIDGTLYLGATARADISATNAVQITHTGPTMNVLRGDGTAGGGISTSTGTFDTAVLVADGSTGVPSIAFTNDPDTGVYRIGNGRVGLTCDGTTRLDVNATRTLFVNRLEPDATNTRDIGQSGNMFRTGYFGTSVVVQTANASTVQRKQATVQSSAMSGASVTLTNLIPAGSAVVGVTVHPTTAITSGDGATTYNVGDGTDVDRWGAAIAFASDVTLANITITSVPIYAAATSVVLTAIGGTFNAGVVRVTVHYDTITAATS